jgi:polyferredoxin
MENHTKDAISPIRRWMQAGFVVITILISVRHLFPGGSEKGGGFDAFCPFGGIETLWVYITTGETLKTTNLLNFSVLLAVLGVSLVAGKAFCGWMCPLGTLQDMLAGWSRRLGGEKNKSRGIRSKTKFPVNVPAKVDKWLRYLKYVVLIVIVLFSTKAIYPPLRDICPARAIFSFDWNTPLLAVVLLVFILTSMLIKRFTCKYICPLGAALAIFNKISPVHLGSDMNNCNNCKRCENDCPMDIESIPENLRSVECVRCLNCLETCDRPDAIDLRLG